jgi:ferrous iron transport protein A
MMRLSQSKKGEVVRIVSVGGGRSIAGKLSDMGIYPGVEVRVISNPGHGPVILLRDGIRLGLGFGMAHRVFVQPGQDDGNNDGDKGNSTE